MKKKLIQLSDLLHTHLQAKKKEINNKENVQEHAISLIKNRENEINDFEIFVKEAIDENSIITQQIVNNFKVKADEIITAINKIN